MKPLKSNVMKAGQFTTYFVLNHGLFLKLAYFIEHYEKYVCLYASPENENFLLS